VVESLQRSKRLGRDFDSAWTRARKGVRWSFTDPHLDRGDWERVLASEEVRAELRACYLDEPSPLGEHFGGWLERPIEDEPEVRIVA
jgi:hypothetical protein